jgi:glycosyltransferase involved in cell wall biosynthesis
VKVALVHDWLNVKSGGAERVFFELVKLYPDADLFSLIYNKKIFADEINAKPVQTSFLQYFPFKNRPKFLLPLIPRAVDQLDLRGYDLIISSSSAWAKNIHKPDGSVHICYCHTPARMLWDYWPRYLTNQKLGPFKPGAISRFIISRTVSKLRLWDFYGSNNVDYFIANSEYIADRIKKFYRCDSTVIYPPISTELLKPPTSNKKGGYYLVLSVLSSYKNIDLVIKAFKQSGRQLIIAGDGPNEAELKGLAAEAQNIKFLGRVSEAKKVQLLQQAKALVFANIEDFGITPVEAMAAGTPVIARNGGGAVETVVEGKTGVFFNQDSIDSLNSAISEAEKVSWKQNELIERANMFSSDKFTKKITTLTSKVKQSHVKI